MIAMGDDLVIGGYFDSIDGVPCANHVARWNGTTWSALGTGVIGSVNVLKYTHGLLYAGTQVDNEFLREWNGSTWEEVGGGPNWDVWDIAVLGDELFITGSFTEAGSNITDGEGGVVNVAISSSYIGSYPLTPEIAIEQPVNTNLVDGSASIDFGTAPQGSSLHRPHLHPAQHRNDPLARSQRRPKTARTAVTSRISALPDRARRQHQHHLHRYLHPQRHGHSQRRHPPRQQRRRREPLRHHAHRHRHACLGQH